jgi:hypothetical protein
MIERFKQLREHFSFFDQYGNVDGVLVREATFKPIVDTYFRQFKLNLYWILPVVKNIRKVYDVEDLEKENNDIAEINLEMDLKNIRELISNYKSNDLPEGQNAYSALYAGLNPFFTPFELVGDDKQNGVIRNKNVNDDINTIIDNLGEMYSSVFHNNGIRNRKFVIQKYNTALSKLNATDLTELNNKITEKIRQLKSSSVFDRKYVILKSTIQYQLPLINPSMLFPSKNGVDNIANSVSIMNMYIHDN